MQAISTNKIKSLFPILLSVFCAIIYGNLFLRSEILAIVFLIAIVLMAFIFINPYKGIYLYLFVLPFCPDYIGFETGGFGGYNFAKLSIICFLIPVIFNHFFKHFVEGKNNFDGEQNFFLFDLLVISFLILSSVGHFINFGFKIGKSTLYGSIIDYYVVYFVITRFITKKELLIKSVEILIYSGLFFCAFGILDYFAQFGFYTRIMCKFFPFIDPSSFGVRETFRSNVSRMQISFAQPLALGIYLTILQTLILSNYKNTFNTPKKIVYLLTFLLSFFSLILTQARGPFVIDCIFIIILLFLRKAKKIFSFLILFILLFALLFSFNVKPNSTIVTNFESGNIQDKKNIAYRSGIYKDFVSKLHKLSLVGEDKKLYKSLQRQFQSDIVVWYLQILIHGGLITFFVFILLIAKVIIHGVIICFRYKEKYMYGCFFAFAALLFCYLGISFIGLARFYFWIILSLCIGIIVYSKKYPFPMNENCKNKD